MCRVELCTELFYAITPTLFLCLFLIYYPYISLHLWCFLFLFMPLFFSSRCMFEQMFAIYQSAESLSSQASSVDVLYRVILFLKVLIFAVFADRLRSVKIKPPNFNPHGLYAIAVCAQGTSVTRHFHRQLEWEWERDRDCFAEVVYSIEDV